MSRLRPSIISEKQDQNYSKMLFVATLQTQFFTSEILFSIRGLRSSHRHLQPFSIDLGVAYSRMQRAKFATSTQLLSVHISHFPFLHYVVQKHCLCIFMPSLREQLCVLSAAVKKALCYPPGSFRAMFEDRILMCDIVFLRTWYPVTVATFYNLVTSLLLSEKMQWTGMKTAFCFSILTLCTSRHHYRSSCPSSPNPSRGRSRPPRPWQPRGQWSLSPTRNR